MRTQRSFGVRPAQGGVGVLPCASFVGLTTAVEIVRRHSGAIVAPSRTGRYLRATRPGGCSTSSAAISARIFSSERRISRDTCICEIPICCAICDCVRPL